MNIQKFLQLKETEAFKNDDDKFFDFPIEYVHPDTKELKMGYLQDAFTYTDDNGNTHFLEVIILDENLKEIQTLVKDCIAPPDCKINWDVVHCAFELKKSA